MKNSENLKQVVFIIGFITLLIGVFGAIANKSLMAYFLPIYAGLTLLATVLLHKEEQNLNTVKR
ncbi:hypothetical protein [uncultured Croceitalea sp.]|uniref:hypothetical protein n=1 Tax=uncultured Croceitalea sp. TaxID=1798908 RepID=UPI0033057A99